VDRCSGSVSGHGLVCAEYDGHVAGLVVGAGAGSGRPPLRIVVRVSRGDDEKLKDQEGIPNVDQRKSLGQKLLAGRFQLAFHRDKKELSAYVITVAKTGPKLNKTGEWRGNLAGFRGRGPGSSAFGIRLWRNSPDSAQQPAVGQNRAQPRTCLRRCSSSWD